MKLDDLVYGRKAEEGSKLVCSRRRITSARYEYLRDWSNRREITPVRTGSGIGDEIM